MGERGGGSPWHQTPGLLQDSARRRVRRPVFQLRPRFKGNYRPPGGGFLTCAQEAERLEPAANDSGRKTVAGTLSKAAEKWRSFT